MNPHAKTVGKGELRPQRPQRSPLDFLGLSPIGNRVPIATPLRPRFEEREAGYGGPPAHIAAPRKRATAQFSLTDTAE